MKKKYLVSGSCIGVVNDLLRRYMLCHNDAKFGKHRRGAVRISGCSMMIDEKGNYSVEVDLQTNSTPFFRVKDFKDGRSYQFQKNEIISFRRLFRFLASADISSQSNNDAK